MYQPSVSPTWDTALAMKALLESGMDPAHPMLARAAEWLVANQIFRPGDWSILNPELEPGGWAFEFANDWFPDTDDSAVILMVLAQLPIAATPAGKRAIAYGLNWTLGMQSRSGGWGAFDTDNPSEFLNRIPFADLEAMVDPPTEDVTGRLLSLMGARGYGPDFGRARRALEFVRRTQRPDGSWWGRWGVNFIYGTWSVLDGLAAIGEDLRAPWVRRAVEWLRARQNADGGWGETVASYDDESLAGKGESTASQTAWALLGLMAADGVASPAVQRGTDWLVRTQGANGTWAEPLFTGPRLPPPFYLRYHPYPPFFPLMALGRYARLLRAARDDPEEIGMLLVATEPGVDHSKPVSIFVHDLLGIGRRCRVYELKHACYAGTAALMTAADWVRAGGSRARRALVIAADIARYEIGSPGEPTQGAGAVAILVGREPQALVLSELSGTYAGNVHDFWRPLDRREAIVDGKYSVECYLDALAGAFMAYRGLERPPLVSGEALADRLVRFLYHTPFPKMAMKAHRRLLEVDGHAAGRAVEDDRAAASYRRQAAPGLAAVARVGNTYTASLYLCLAALLEAEGRTLAGERLGLFSYGSGRCAEFFTGSVPEGVEAVADAGGGALLAGRTFIDVPAYERLVRRGRAGGA